MVSPRADRILVLAVFLTFVGCGQSRLFLNGEEDVIGAEIFIDGRSVGKMKGVQYIGTTSTDPLVKERERKLQEQLGVRPGRYFASAIVSVPAGRHVLVLVSEKGQRLEKEVEILRRELLGRQL